METLSQRQTRRLALARAGLLKPEWLGLPRKAQGRGRRARDAAHRLIRHFGYLQIDSISISGARTHGLVLLSRLEGFDAALAEELLTPGEPIFEYWGHEASWLPLELYPAMGWRRQDFQVHPWWGDLLEEHPQVARGLLDRIRQEGPLRSLDLEDDTRLKRSGMVWVQKLAKKVALALWSAGELSIRQRRNFQRSFDLTERVIPEAWRRASLTKEASIKLLLEKALDGHGWAPTGTLTSTWRLRNLRGEVATALEELREEGTITVCSAQGGDGKTRRGWIRPEDLELAARLDRVRPRRDRGVLLSPFDPVLWDRPRVLQLFDFEQLLEVFKPADQRVYGYYCLPVLAGERLIGRLDLKAHRKQGTLEIISCWYEAGAKPSAEDVEAVRAAVERYTDAVELKAVWPG